MPAEVEKVPTAWCQVPSLTVFVDEMVLVAPL